MLAAGFLPRWGVALLGLACAVFSALFSLLDMSFIRLGFETLALAGCGLFVGELLRNRRLSLEAQERLRVLVETSPAAIVTVDERGFIELANRAAAELIAAARWTPGRQSDRRLFARTAPCLAVGRGAAVSDRRCNAGAIVATASLSWRTCGFPPTRRGRGRNWPRSSPTSPTTQLRRLRRSGCAFDGPPRASPVEQPGDGCAPLPGSRSGK